MNHALKMAKRLLSLVVMLALGSLTAHAQFTFTTNADNTTLTITGYTDTNQVVIIPSSINNYPVTAIGSSAFYNNRSIKSVVIPIGVTSIGGVAFANCSSLASVTIPNSVTIIGGSAFYSCSSLNSIAIPSSVIAIQNEALVYCSSLTNITVDVSNSSYASAGGVLFYKNMKTLIQYPGGLTGNYTIPDSVTSIGGYAFENCSGLSNVSISTNVTSIGYNAFERAVPV